MSDDKEEAFKAAVEQFHTRYDADIKQIIAATSEVNRRVIPGNLHDYNDHGRIDENPTIPLFLGTPEGLNVRFDLPSELGNLQSGISYKSPVRISSDRSTRIDYFKGLDTKRVPYRNVKGLVELITRALPQLQQQATAEANLAGGDPDKLSTTGRKVAEVYHLLTTKLLPEWKENDYLANLEQMGVDIARTRNKAATRQEEDAEDAKLQRSTNNLANVLAGLGSESKRAK